MSLSDYLPSTKFLLHPDQMFKSKNGKPFMQSLARNLGESLTNKASADYTNEHMLQDQPQSTPSAGFSGLLSTSPQVGGPTTGGAPAQKQNTGADLMTILQAMSQKQGVS